MITERKKSTSLCNSHVKIKIGCVLKVVVHTTAVYLNVVVHTTAVYFNLVVHTTAVYFNMLIDATITNFIDNYNQLSMFRAIISPILRSTRLCLQLVV